jgi:hypothetical protein
MCNRRLILALCLSLLTSGWSMAADQADPQEKLETAIPEMIRLLEAKEHKQLIERFADPMKIAEISKRVGLEKIVEQFAAEKASVLLNVLKEVQKIKPTMNADGTEANYTFEKPIDGKRDFTMMQVDKRWYIKN